MTSGAPAAGGPSLAVVLFTDLVGSTALRSRVGDETAEAIRRRHDNCLGEAVTRHAGRVVKSTGDGIMAVFSGSSEAVAAAVEMQQAISRISMPGVDGPLAIRVGVAAGDVSWEGDDCFGTPVVEAARLCAANEAGGQILVSDVVRLLAGSRASAPFEPLGELTLKGLAAPLTTWRVAWQSLSEEVPLPPGLATTTALPFVGRDETLAALHRAWTTTVGGARRTVVVAGEPGIGKTRLLSEFARQVTKRDAAVLYGRAEEHLGVPYGPFVEALDGYVQATPVDRLASQLGSTAGELVRLVPSLPGRVPGLEPPMQAEPETERFRLFAAVAELLAGVAKEHPVLLVLDDLQWATAADIMLLAHLVREKGTAPVLVLVAYRDSEVGADHPLTSLLGELPRLGPTDWVRLGGIDDTDVGALLVKVTSRSLDDDGRRLAQAVYDETGGNPFFVEEVLRHLAEVDNDRATAWDLGRLGVPEGVREVVGRRLARLPGGADAVLTTASVIGPRFDLALLLAVTGDEMTALEALSAAEAAALVLPDTALPGVYRFAHALVHATLYDRMASAQRLMLHRKVGIALERLPGERFAELARHFAVAVPLGEVDKAIEYARRAGDQSRAALAFEQAAVLYQQAVDLTAQQASPALDARCDLLTALGDVLHRAGDPRHREALFAAAADASALDDAERLARAALALNLAGEWPPLGAVDDELVTLLDEAILAVGESNLDLRARLQSLLALELMFSADVRRLSVSQEAVALARRLGDPATLARVLISAHWGGATANNLDERLAIAHELVALGDTLKDYEIACWGQLFLYDDLLGKQCLDEALAALSRAEQLADELRQPAFRWEALYRRAAVTMLAGRLDEAEQLAGAALDLGAGERGVERMAFGIYMLQLGRLRFEQGRTGEILEAAEETLKQQPDIGLSWHAALSLFYSENHDDERARAHYAAAASTDWSGMGDHAWVEGLALASLVAPRSHDERGVQTLYDRLTPYSGQVNYPRAFVEEPVDYMLAVLATSLGRYDDAERHLATAEEVCQRLRAPTSLARVHLQRAVILHQRGAGDDASQVRELAGHALAEAVELGLGRVREQAQEFLDQLATPVTLGQPRPVGAGP